MVDRTLTATHKAVPAAAFEQKLGITDVLTGYNVGTFQITHGGTYLFVAGETVDFYTAAGAYRGNDVIATIDSPTKFTITAGIGALIPTDILKTRADLPVYYRNGATSWSRNAPNGFGVEYTAVTRLHYNRLNAGSYNSQLVAANGSFVAYWMVETNITTNPVIMIMGQRQDTTLAAAKDNNQWAHLALGVFPSYAFRPLHRFIYRTDSGYTNTPRAQIVDVVDVRSTPFIGSTVISFSHSQLADTTTDGHPIGAVYQVPIPISRINGNHEALEYYQLDTGTDEYCMVMAQIPVGVDVINNDVKVTFQCSWAVAPAAGPWLVVCDILYRAVGGDADVYQLLDQTVIDELTGNIGIDTHVASTMFNVIKNIAAGNLAAGMLFKIKLRMDGVIPLQTLRVHAVSIQIV
jgi:hypothetical protein